jgi:hypothetical protein
MAGAAMNTPTDATNPAPASQAIVVIACFNIYFSPSAL